MRALVFAAMIPCLFLPGVYGRAQEAVKTFPVEQGGRKLQLIDNSISLSQAIGLTSQGSIIGVREIESATPGVLRQVSFYKGAHGDLDLAIPDTFTNAEVTAISENDLVVGYATRPVGNRNGSLRALVWETKNNRTTLLPLPEDDIACQAQDISGDGKRITGYSTGFEKLRPVLWTQGESAVQWTVTVLPTIHELNPYLMSSRLLISPDGQTIVGCCTEQFLPGGLVDSSLYAWREESPGEWTQSMVHREQMHLKGLNNRGDVVGAWTSEGGPQLPRLITAQGDLVVLELLPGDDSGEALDINQESLIVGSSSDPHGPEGGPEPCLWDRSGQVQKYIKDRVVFGSLNCITDRGEVAGMIELGSENADGKVLAFFGEK
jgi:uncharacterized membrane protein